MANPKQPGRSIKTKQDLGSIPAIEYNDPVGAKKVIVVQPAIVRATLANEIVGAGRLVKIAAGPYGVDLLGRAYNSGNTYQKGDIVTETSTVYMAMQDNITGTFDATMWKAVAQKQITGIPAPDDSVVSTGRWHNAITVAGWLVDDDSTIDYTRVRD